MEKENQELEENFLIRAAKAGVKFTEMEPVPLKAEEEESQGLAESLIRAAKAGVKFTEMEPVPLKSAEPEREI